MDYIFLKDLSMSDKKLLFFSENEIKSILSIKETINLMKDAFRQISQGMINTPLRTNLNIVQHDANALFMPAHSKESDLISIKLVTVFKSNLNKKLPLIHALVILMDGTNGRPLSVMDGEYLTALRTGAASGLATDFLARSESGTLGIIGAGVQGRTQIAAVCEVRPIKKVIIIDKNPEAAESFAEYAENELGLSTELNPTGSKISDCDIICTATLSPTPVFSDTDLKAGVHINAIGAYQPDKRELPGETIRRSKVVVDQRSACLEEAGDIIIPIQDNLIKASHIHAELGEIVTGQKSGRSDNIEITVFKSVGNAAQDLITAGEIYKKAQKSGIGTSVSL
jgi:alanine dehydrogenase